MWGHLLFYHLKCFLRITPLRKQLNPSKPNIKVIQQTTDAIFVQNQRDGINFGQIKSNVNKINQIASSKCQNLLIKLYSKHTQVVADMSTIAHLIHRSRESCVFKTEVKSAFCSTKTDRRENGLDLLQMPQIRIVNVDRFADMFIKQHLRRLFNPTMYFEWIIVLV